MIRLAPGFLFLALISGLVPQLRAQAPVTDVYDPPRQFGADKAAGPDAKSVQAVSVVDGTIIAELSPGSFGAPNLLDLEGRTLVFAPDGSGGYNMAVESAVWDFDFGASIDAAGAGYPTTVVPIENFSFPFAGSAWSEIRVGAYGVIGFGVGQDAIYRPGPDRFVRFNDFGSQLAARRLPFIAALLRRLGGEFDRTADEQEVNRVHVRQDADALLVTWDISEPYGGLGNFTVQPKPNRFQARLHHDGRIELTYESIEVEDGIVGVFSPPECQPPQRITVISDPSDAGLPGYVDITEVELLSVDNCAIEVRMRLRGNTLAPGDARIEGLFYRIFVDLEAPFLTGTDFDDADFEAGVAHDGALGYTALGTATTGFEVAGSEVRFRVGIGALGGAEQVAVFFDAVDFVAERFDGTEARTLAAPANPATERDLSALAGQPVSSTVFESFHYTVMPPNGAILCGVLPVTGDRFDMAAVYTDFRIDTQEAGARSSGPIGDAIQGLSAMRPTANPADWCTGGELEVVQDYVAAGTPITAARGRLDRVRFEDYGAQVALLSHELGHRWMAYADAQTPQGFVSLHAPGDPVHYAGYMHTPSPGVVSTEFDNSPMGGAFYIDNGDGTFTNPVSGFFYPAKAYSWLDLYFMGLLAPAQVPDFFLIDDLAFDGFDAQGRVVFRGSRVDVTIDDVMAANGPRMPPAGTQIHFELALIGVVKPGRAPSERLLDRVPAIGKAFEDYWPLATHGLSTLAANSGLGAASQSSGLGGLWFDPALEGSGFNLLMVGGDLIVTFYGYGADGTPLWLLSETIAGPIEAGETYRDVGLLYGNDGTGRLGAPQPPESLATWGRMTLTFDDCSRAAVRLEGDDGVLDTTISLLASQAGTECDIASTKADVARPAGLTKDILAADGSTGLAGLWFDPSLSGSGFNILRLADVLILTYFGYGDDGDQLWLISEAAAPVEAGDTLELRDVRMLHGNAGEGDLNNPQPPATLSDWGTLEVSFDSCSTATAVLDGVDGRVEMQLQQLARNDGTSC